jgi:DNA-binding response OmpR family regulator/drug/metabolite transporter (DMT)-like permease
VNSGQILVIDDNAISRQKMGLAVKALGYSWIGAQSGRQGLDLLERQKFDLILLDIVMPEMDGFEVLEHLRAKGPSLVTPVLVISGLDDDMESVARAIRMGAEDFLPKTFDATIFRARVTSSIEKSRLRAVELDNLRQVDRLSAAAAVIEGEAFHPRDLAIDDLASRGDALGRLARVFNEMAQQVYDRERQLQRNLQTVKGTTLLLLSGAISGLSVPISILLFQVMPQPVGVSFWVNLLTGVICLTIAVGRGKLARLTREGGHFVGVWAVLLGVSTILSFIVAGHVSGIMLSIIFALEGFTVFLIAAILRIEQPTLRRFAGLATGLFGVVVLLVARDRISGVVDWAWILLAILVPVLYGLMGLLLASRHLAQIDPTAGVGLVMLGSAVFILPLAWAQGSLFMLGPHLGEASALIVFEAVRGAAGNIAFVYLMAVGGAVFGSQGAYVSTVAGIGWSMLLLGEALSVWTLAALLLIIVGLVLVGPKREADDMAVRFVRRSKRA